MVPSPCARFSFSVDYPAAASQGTQVGDDQSIPFQDEPVARKSPDFFGALAGRFSCSLGT
jgi:hypothetical protein